MKINPRNKARNTKGAPRPFCHRAVGGELGSGAEPPLAGSEIFGLAPVFIWPSQHADDPLDGEVVDTGQKRGAMLGNRLA